MPPQAVKKQDAHSILVCVPVPGVLASAHSQNGHAGLSIEGGYHLPQWGSGARVSRGKNFEILDANFCFPVHFLPKKLTPAKCRIPHISIPDCITCTQHGVALKTGQLASRPGLWQEARQMGQNYYYYYYNRFTALFRDHPCEPVLEENFWTLWCKGRLTEADTDHPAGRHSIRTNQMGQKTGHIGKSRSCGNRTADCVHDDDDGLCVLSGGQQ